MHLPQRGLVVVGDPDIAHQPLEKKRSDTQEHHVGEFSY